MAKRQDDYSAQFEQGVTNCFNQEIKRFQRLLEGRGRAAAIVLEQDVQQTRTTMFLRLRFYGCNPGMFLRHFRSWACSNRYKRSA